MMKTICSTNNEIFKDLLRLRKRKYREREGKYLIEGENLVREAIASRQNLEQIVFREGGRFETDEWFRVEGANPVILSEKLFAEAADTETSQGILAVLRKPETALRPLMEAVGPGENLIIFDRLQDPGNLGTILRTAAGAGIRAAVALKGTADLFAPKTVRAASGALFQIQAAQDVDREELLDHLAAQGKTLCVTSVRDAVPYYEADLRKNAAIVIGNEGNGCDPVLLERADIRVHIPMAEGMESLNAAVAAGILIYEAVRPKS